MILFSCLLEKGRNCISFEIAYGTSFLKSLAERKALIAPSVASFVNRASFFKQSAISQQFPYSDSLSHLKA